jgi:hypothetical protein
MRKHNKKMPQNIISDQKNKKFQIHAKKLFLTYPQTDVTPQEAFDQLS